MSSLKIIVAGAAGQLGGAIIREFQSEQVMGLARTELDVTDHAAVLDTIAKAKPDVIINCAAYNQVDEAEDDAVAALETNAFAVRSLARAASEVGATLIHYSTDFVFDGHAAAPYVETDEPNPRSVYGVSKLIGEWFAVDAQKSYVLRVESLFGGSPARSSVDRIIDSILEDRETRAFTDRVVSPSYVVDVANATRALLELAAPCGVYHCVNSGSATWLELAEEVGRLLGRSGRLLPVSMADVKLPAARPKYCVLSNQKLERAGSAMPTWQDALARYITVRGTPPPPSVSGA